MLNRYTGLNPYRGFESLPSRGNAKCAHYGGLLRGARDRRALVVFGTTNRTISWPHRLRFAPSPTGYLHVGGARTALFNWLYVKHYGGQFLLRVEDTDKARSTEESTRAIFEGLEWLGLDWDEDVVFQGANLARHQADVAAPARRGQGVSLLLHNRRARRAAQGGRGARRGVQVRPPLRPTAAPDEVARRVAAGMPFVVRFRMPDGETSWTDLVHGPITFANKDIGEGDFIILRSDGTPIYNLAVVSDDIAMDITLVMRGDDHISNTPKQILLYKALGATVPEFAHLPMIHGLDGKKLSKRHGATAVGDYRTWGFYRRRCSTSSPFLVGRRAETSRS